MHFIQNKQPQLSSAALLKSAGTGYDSSDCSEHSDSEDDSPLQKSIQLMQLQQKKLVYYKHFIAVWKKYRLHIKIRRQIRFARCDICCDNRDTIRYSMSSEVKNEARKVLHLHYEYVKKERNMYYSKRNEAKNDPSNYLSMIIDGSDMANYGVPYFHANSKACKGWKMRVGLIGVLIHGIGSRCFMFHKHWSNDSNLTIEVLHRTLNTLRNIPPVLYLQVSNHCQ